MKDWTGNYQSIYKTIGASNHTDLEGQARRKMFEENPPKKIYVFSGRVKCAKNGDFDSMGSSAVAYAWFVWEKGFRGEPIIKWVN